ncbi:MAG: alpha-amylase family glycosyl hydrolase [Myxococcota bacterium]
MTRIGPGLTPAGRAAIGAADSDVLSRRASFETPRDHLEIERGSGVARVAPTGVQGQSTERPVIYQLVVRTFGNVEGTNRPNGEMSTNGVGKFAHVNDAALTSLKTMGVTHIWLTGVMRQATATDYRGLGLPADDPDILKGKAGSFYAVRDYYDVSPDYALDPAARREEFRALVDRIHGHGMKVMVDFVPNHVARSYHSVVRPDEDFGVRDDQSRFFSPQNNFFYLQSEPQRPLVLEPSPTWEPPAGADGRFAAEDGSPGHRVRMSGNRVTYVATTEDWKEVVKLNYGYNPETGEKRFEPVPDTWGKMDRVLDYWQTDMGVDGFRVDYAHVVPKEFWQWALARAHARNPESYFVAEAYESAPDKIPGFRLEDLLDAGFRAVYDDDLYDGLRGVVLGPKWANDITAWLEKHAGRESELLHYGENHDEARIAAPRRPDAAPASGLGSMWAGRPLAAVLYLATRGPNLLYAGQEVGEPARGREGFGGDDGRTTIFDYWKVPQLARWVGTEHRYDGTDLSDEQRRLRKFYSEILKLSQSAPFGAGQRYNIQQANAGRPDYDSGEHVYSFVRHDAQGHRALVVVNFSSDATLHPTVRLPAEALAKMGLRPDAMVKLRPALTTSKLPAAARASALVDRGLELEIEPYGVAVVLLDEAP